MITSENLLNQDNLHASSTAANIRSKRQYDNGYNSCFSTHNVADF
jgi:hypothetical protein